MVIRTFARHFHMLQNEVLITRADCMRTPTWETQPHQLYKKEEPRAHNHQELVKPEITPSVDANCYGLLEVMAFLRFIYICFIGIGGFKSYGLLEVMGYHSMGYLRFDCNANNGVPTRNTHAC
jgi:hypothetical protein